MKYSYKKGWSVAEIGGTSKILYCQSIFASRILTKLLLNNLIINIDECSF